MFPAETALRDTFRARVDDVSDVLGLSEAQRHARHREFVSVVRQTGLDPRTIGDPIYQAWTDAEIAAARGGAAVDSAQVRAWDEEFRKELRLTYGADAEDLTAILPAIERPCVIPRRFRFAIDMLRALPPM